MKPIILFFWLLFAAASWGQIYPQIGARANALGGTALSSVDVFSVYNNPGAFGMLDKTAVGVNYENRYLLKELSTQSLAFGYHSKKAGNFGVHMQQYGFSLYREIQGGITYGMKFYKNFSGGISLNFHRIALGENYGNKNTFSAALGLLYDMNDELSFSMRVLNLNRAKLAADQDERLPTTFALGARYNFSDKAFWTLEAEKDLIYPLNVKSGIEIQPHPIFAVRFGVMSYPFQASAGFGLKFSNFYFDMASSWHAQLGLSPSAGLHYEF